MMRIVLLLWLAPLLSLSQPHGTLYFTDASYNVIYKLVGIEAEPIVSDGLGFPWRLATDSKSIYWTSVDTNLIEKSDLDGRNRQALAVITYPEGISVDRATGNIYISEAGTPAIILLPPPSYLPDTIYTEGLVDPDNIIFHPLTKKLYWVDVALGQIIMAEADGSGYTVLFEDSAYDPQAITLDKEARFLYWADIKQHGIVKFNLINHSIELLVTGIEKPTAVAINSKHKEVVWIDSSNRSLGWKQLNNSELHKLIIDELSSFHSGLIIVD